MDCRETRGLLAAFHDGELDPADRARVAEHLRGCGECAALLARLAGVDANVDVPDPGPEYWERFTGRVMERVDRDRVASIEAARPKRGWAIRPLPYLVPAVAAAALVVLVVRHTGLDPFTSTGPRVPPAVAKPGPAEPGREGAGKTAPESVLAKKPGEIPAASQPPAGRDGRPRPRTTGREERIVVIPRAIDRAAPAGAAPAAPLAGAPPAGSDRDPAPHSAGQSSIAADLRGTREDASGVYREKKETGSGERSAASVAETSPAPRPSFAPRSDAPGSAPAPFAGRERVARERAATPGPDKDQAAARADAAAESEAAGGKPVGSAARSKAVAGTGDGAAPCEAARELAAQGRLKEAEAAQRACLERNLAPAVQEGGLVFLAELLDRQSRFDEADAVIREARRQFPASRPLDVYLQQRPQVQGGRLPAAR